jgi:hypothetical protein
MKVKTSPLWGLYQLEGEGIRKGGRRVNMVGVLCIHVWKRHNETFGNCFKKGRRVIKEKDGERQSN